MRRRKDQLRVLYVRGVREALRRLDAGVHTIYLRRDLFEGTGDEVTNAGRSWGGRVLRNLGELGCVVRVGNSYHTTALVDLTATFGADEDALIALTSSKIPEYLRPLVSLHLKWHPHCEGEDDQRAEEKEEIQEEGQAQEEAPTLPELLEQIIELVRQNREVLRRLISMYGSVLSLLTAVLQQLQTR